MKRILFTLLFIMMSPSIFASDKLIINDEWAKWFDANNQTIKGEMSCKITDQIVIEVVEGKPKRYTHYTDKPKVGDKLSLIYKTIGEKINFELKHPLEVYFVKSFYADKGFNEVASFNNFNNSGWSPKFHLDRLTIRKDSLSYQDYNVLGGFSLEMMRYYKNDWDGILTFINAGNPQIITLDCRNITDRIDEIIERYKNYPGKWEIQEE